MAGHPSNLPASIHQRLLNQAKERSLSHKSIYLVPKCGIAFRNIDVFVS